MTAARPGPAVTDAAPPGLSRLSWLDALRAIAVLLVLYEHLTWHVLGVLRSHTQAWFDAGRTGVFLFFIISGYIVPTSLERHGSLRRFWVSRVFRLYPLIVVGTLAALLLAATGVVPLDPVAIKKMLATALASATMLQDLLGLPSTPAVLWSLSYEMVFYLLISALFVFGLHRRSAEWALLFAGVAVALGGILPVSLLSLAGIGVLGAAALTLIGTFSGVAALLTGRRRLVVAGAVMVGAVAVGLMVNSSRFPSWYTMSIPAMMFAGTALHRAERGQIGWRKAGWTAGAVFVGTASAMWWSLPDASWQTVKTTGHWVGSVVLAAGIFAVGMRLRHRRFPTPLVTVGLISYSVYVLHYVLLQGLEGILDRFHGSALIVQVFAAAAFVGLVVGVSALTYRWVEQPMQRYGRGLARLLDRLLGPDTTAAREAPVDPAPEPAAAADAVWVPELGVPAQPAPLVAPQAASGP